ncbi:MAG: ABC transporter substrate-binding protein [Nisaea sp.]|uniref:heme/hemin ABC transporter substrate-binding protein n=1 Tax=Nisaea sp. TaxID=2024842 RepID=UPI003297C7BB
MSGLVRLLLAAVILLPAVRQADATDNRIAVISSSIAEIVVALGEGGNVVLRGGGTDHIPEITDAVRLPGYSQPSAEGMLAVGPTIALLSARRTKPIVKEQLAAAGVEAYLFETLTDLSDLPDRVRAIAKLLGREDRAEAVIASFHGELAAAKALVDNTESRPRGLFLLSGGGRPTVVAGGDTHIASLIRLAGGVNVTDGISLFKPMNQEAMMMAAPDFIIVNKEGLGLAGGEIIAFQAPGVQLTPAARNGAVFSMPSGYLTDLGVSTPKAITVLARKIHPELN